jgi:hypothetical protein
MQQAEPPQCTPGNWGPLTRGFVPFVRCD